MPVSQELQNRIAQQFPWMNAEMLNAYTTSWGEFADPGLALSEVRSTASYATVFYWNFYDQTGSVRMSESDYFANKASFDATIVGAGMNPDYFQDEWVMALEGDVKGPVR